MSQEIIHERRSDDSSSVLWAERDTRGAWVISGQDISRSFVEIFGDSDYEYWITLPLKDSRDITIEMLREAAHRDPGGSRAIMAWLKERKIRYRFESYM